MSNSMEQRSREADGRSSAKFEVFTAVKIEVEFFWVVTPCSVMVGYQHFGGPYCMHVLGCDAV